MPAILDAGAMLMPHGAYSSNQSFTPLLVYPCQLPVAMLHIHMLMPPAGPATFLLEVARTSDGIFSEIAGYTWPPGIAGSRQVAIGVSSSVAEVVDNQALWMRLSLVTSGALTASAWLSTPGGRPGLGAKAGDLLTEV